MGGWVNVARIGRIFAQSVTMQNYFPDVKNISGVASFPWSVNCMGSTDHSSNGGIYAGGCRVGESKSNPASYETYNQAVARGAFDYLPAKPAGNPIYTDADSGYGSTETPCLGKVGSEYFMTAQVGVNGSDQPTFLTVTDDLINFTNYDRGDGEPFVIDGGIDDNFPAKDFHRGYFGWASNPFPDVPYIYVGYGLHGGGDKPLNAFYGSNDCKNWVTLAIVSDYQFPDNVDVPAGWGIWWNGIDVGGIRDAGGGEYSMVVSIGDLNHGGAGRQSKLYEIFVAGDGVTVTRQPRLLLDVGGVGDPDSDEVSAPMFLDDNGQWLMYYQGADSSAQNSLMLASLEWDDTLEKPEPISRPNHDKYTVNYADGAFPAGITVESGTPSFTGSGIQCTPNERFRAVDSFTPDTVKYIEVNVKQTGNGTNTARLTAAAADDLSSGRAVNGVEAVTYSSGLFIQQSVGGDSQGLSVETAYPVNQNNTRSNVGIRWNPDDDELWLLVGDGWCKNASSLTTGIDTSLPVELIAGNINFGTIDIEEATFRVGTIGSGVAPSVASQPVGSSNSVSFVFSESVIGDGSGITIKQSGSPVSGVWTRPTDSTATFTSSDGDFSGVLTYDIAATDIRNSGDLVQIQDVTGQTIDFTPPEPSSGLYYGGLSLGLGIGLTMVQYGVGAGQPSPPESTLYVNHELSGGTDLTAPPTSHGSVFSTTTGIQSTEYFEGFYEWLFNDEEALGRGVLSYDLFANNPSLTVGNAYVISYECEKIGAGNYGAALAVTGLSNVTVNSTDTVITGGSTKRVSITFTVDDATFAASFRFGCGTTSDNTAKLIYREPRLETVQSFGDEFGGEFT